MTNKKQGGFTLIEVLIATVMLGIAIGASLNALATFADHIGLMKQRYYSHIIAWNALVQGLIKNKEGKLEDMRDSGEDDIGGTSWSWTIVATEPEGLEEHTHIARYVAIVDSSYEDDEIPASVLRAYRLAP